MSKIIAYLFNNDYLEISNDILSPPLNTFAFLTEDYDITDRNGINMIIYDINKIELCERAMKEIHEKRKKTISEEISQYYTLIGNIETQSQNANNKEYIGFSDKVNDYTEQIDKLILKIYQLNSMFEAKYKNIRQPIPEIIYNQQNLTKVNNNSINLPQQVYFQPKPQYIYPEQRIINNGPENSDYSGLVQQMGERISNIKGWDKDAVETVQNWRILFKEYKYIYEWILERNYKISTNLNLISVVSSSMMGCFSAFKLWVQDDRTFQAASDIIMLFSNFLIAAITTSSKRYIDDNRNEKIRNYLEDVSKFLGTISAELIKSPEYRMEADEFIKSQQEIYSKLSINKPNVTISELTNFKNAYINFENSFLNFSTNQTQTEKNV